jgi:hypothetical protein
MNAASLAALALAFAANAAFFAALDQGMNEGAQRVLASMAEPERVLVTAKRHEGEFAQCPGTKTL